MRNEFSNIDKPNIAAPLRDPSPVDENFMRATNKFMPRNF